jgi:hypothetical protein
VIVVGDLVSQIGHLRFEARAVTGQESLSHISHPLCVLAGAVLKDALSCLKAKVQSVKRRIPLFKHIHYAQRLQVVFKSAVLGHTFVELVLAGMPEWRVAKIMGKRDRFNQILVQPQSARNRSAYLGHFDAVRKARSEQIALVIDENLRLVFQPAERTGVDDAVSITLKLTSSWRTGLCDLSAARTLVHCIGRQ